jgi:polar amino acid transport system substrate-binding protein
MGKPARDTSETSGPHVKIRHALRESEARFQTLFEHSPISIWEEDFSEVKRRFDQLREEGVEDFDVYLSQHPEEVINLASKVKILDVNETSVAFFHAASKEELITNLPAYFTSESFPVFKQEMTTLAEGGTTFNCEIPIRTPTDEAMVLSLTLAVVPGCETTLSRVLVSFIDITERKRLEASLRASAEEKKVLLQEIHHRVKNNFAVVSSLLGFQADSLEDEEACEALRASQQRIHTMALIHEQLYNAPDLAQIDFAIYVQLLTDNILSAYTTGLPFSVQLELDVRDVVLKIKQAIPVGLIINELLANALKHAFPEQVTSSEDFTGKISLVMHPHGTETYTLTISDNGVGMPMDTNDRQTASDTRSLGFFLIDAFVQQLNGTLTWETGQGTTCTLTFPQPTKVAGL